MWVKRQMSEARRQRVVDTCIYCRETSIKVGRLVFGDFEVSAYVLVVMKLVNTMPPVDCQAFGRRNRPVKPFSAQQDPKGIVCWSRMRVTWGPCKHDEGAKDWSY